MRVPLLSPRAYRTVTRFALGALAVIVVSGGAVRLTGSGLGCSDWPACEDDRFVAPLEFHPMVEFANRTVTGLVSLAVIVAVLGALRRRPYRRDLTVLAFGLVAGVLGQIVLGGITVMFDLWPPLVMGHFLLSMLLLWNAALLHHRAGEAGDGPSRAVAGGAARRLVHATFAATAVAVFTGTIVTASGPHAGDEDAARLGPDLPDVARLHGLSVALLVVLTLGALAALRRGGGPPAAVRAARVLLGALAVQAAIGYVQYFNGVPALLVGFHLAGAVVVWIAAVRLHLSIDTRVPAPASGDLPGTAPLVPA